MKNRRETKLVYDAAYYKANRPRIDQRVRANALRDEVYAAYGDTCACCGTTERAFLSLDHIHGDGSTHRRLRKDGSRRPRRAAGYSVYADVRREGFPKDKYRLLCMNCNFATRYGKKCPHQQKVEALIASLSVAGVS